MKRRIIGIDFHAGSIEDAVDQALKGGLTVVPAGPGLAKDFMKSPEYRQALLSADLAITDSGFMVLLWWLRTGERLNKNSGLAFLRELQKRGIFRNGGIFWIMPSEDEHQRTKAWLVNEGAEPDDEDFYIAPFYGSGAIEDAELLDRLASRKPQIVIIGLGGGVQERLGLYLREHLRHNDTQPPPGLFCIGAAIAFLTGGQAQIPEWADRLSLGWFFRILQDPRRFLGRYWRAFRLAPAVFRWRDQLPPM
jgi:exopolysaccharide biosynthesis WecB/TagA/CpsF family protein